MVHGKERLGNLIARQAETLCSRGIDGSGKPDSQLVESQQEQKYLNRGDAINKMWKELEGQKSIKGETGGKGISTPWCGALAGLAVQRAAESVGARDKSIDGYIRSLRGAEGALKYATNHKQEVHEIDLMDLSKTERKELLSQPDVIKPGDSVIFCENSSGKTDWKGQHVGTVISYDYKHQVLTVAEGNTYGMEFKYDSKTGKCTLDKTTEFNQGKQWRTERAMIRHYDLRAEKISSKAVGLDHLPRDKTKTITTLKRDADGKVIKDSHNRPVRELTKVSFQRDIVIIRPKQYDKQYALEKKESSEEKQELSTKQEKIERRETTEKPLEVTPEVKQKQQSSVQECITPQEQARREFESFFKIPKEKSPSQQQDTDLNQTTRDASQPKEYTKDAGSGSTSVEPSPDAGVNHQKTSPESGTDTQIKETHQDAGTDRESSNEASINESTGSSTLTDAEVASLREFQQESRYDVSPTGSASEPSETYAQTSETADIESSNAYSSERSHNSVASGYSDSSSSGNYG